MGDEILIEQKIEFSTTWDLWKNFIALAAITAGFLVLAYIQLRRIKKQNRKTLFFLHHFILFRKINHLRCRHCQY
jgi:hypothetical protein